MYRKSGVYKPVIPRTQGLMICRALTQGASAVPIGTWRAIFGLVVQGHDNTVSNRLIDVENALNRCSDAPRNEIFYTFDLRAILKVSTLRSARTEPVKLGLCFLWNGRLEALGEPAVDRIEKIQRLSPTPLLDQQSGEVTRCAQLPESRVLFSCASECPPECGFRTE